MCNNLHSEVRKWANQENASFFGYLGSKIDPGIEKSLYCFFNFYESVFDFLDWMIPTKVKNFTYINKGSNNYN